eukprot:8089146-Alexandrium_andersonii.AAC.1
MQHRRRRSELELRGPRNGLETGPQRSGGLRSAPLFVQILNPPTKAGTEGVRSRESARSQAPVRNPRFRNPHNPWFSTHEKP